MARCRVIRSTDPARCRSTLPYSFRGLSSREESVSSRGNQVQPLLSEVHKHHIHHQPMQPGAECRLAPKAANLAEKLKKRLLREVFSPARVADHPQAKRENPPFMGFVKLLESSLIALLGFPDEFCYSLPLIGRLRRCARFRTQVVIGAAASPPMGEMRGLVLELSKFA